MMKEKEEAALIDGGQGKTGKEVAVSAIVVVIATVLAGIIVLIAAIA